MGMYVHIYICVVYIASIYCMAKSEGTHGLQSVFHVIGMYH